MAYVRTEYPEFSWSMGRFKLLTTCERKYFYHYYGGHNGWELWRAPQEQQEIYLLKKLNNKYSLSGDIVHKAIKNYINNSIVNSQEGGIDKNIDKYISEAINSFKMHIYSSKKYGSTWTPKIKGFEMLQEFYYEEGLDNDEQIYISNNMRNCLNTFVNSKTLSEMMKEDIEVIENDEDKIAEFYHEGTKVYVKVDLLYKIGDKYVIVDWKTGKEDDEDENQVLLYSKYVSEIYDVDPSNIVCRLEYLKTGDNREFQFEREDIEDMNYLIQGNIAKMNEYLEDLTLNKPKPVETFSKCNNGIMCNNCNFRKKCRK